ncbi:MAG: hypothetical protein MR625_07310, partial [Clostridium sp.]|nr:hypothetical protein [Clostridium sp.]
FNLFIMIFLSLFLLVFSSTCCQLPAWVFSLAFLFLHPQHGLSSLDSYLRAQFSLRYLPISFRHGFSSLRLSSYTHNMGFQA